MLLKFSRFLALLTALARPSLATASSASGAQALLHARDYLAVDHPGVVADGAITNTGEYAEQWEFAAQVIALINTLPDHAEKGSLSRSAHELDTAIKLRAPGTEAQTMAHGLAAAIIRADKVTPPAAPSIGMGRAVRREGAAALQEAGKRRTTPSPSPRSASSALTPILKDSACN